MCVYTAFESGFNKYRLTAICYTNAIHDITLFPRHNVVFTAYEYRLSSSFHMQCGYKISYDLILSKNIRFSLKIYFLINNFLYQMSICRIVKDELSSKTVSSIILLLSGLLTDEDELVQTTFKFFWVQYTWDAKVFIGDSY